MSKMILSILLVTALGGCASTPRRGGGESASLADLERRVVTLQQQATVSEVELRRLRQKVAELEARIGGTAPVRSGASSAPPPRAVAEFRTEEPLPRDLLADGVEGEEIDLPPSVPPPRSVPAPPIGAQPQPARGPAAAPPSSDAQGLYDQAYTLFHEKRYDSSEAEFERFLALYPTSDLADNAQFWIGESRYARGEYAAALEAFTLTVERFPEGNKVADALLKAGKTLEALGDRQRARGTYEEVRRRFPGSAAAALADERLTALE